jgi:small subunit ribosomal protein S19
MDVGKIYNVHNGKEFKEIFVEDKMVGHKWGEFAKTREGSHILKKKRKKVNIKKNKG